MRAPGAHAIALVCGWLLATAAAPPAAAQDGEYRTQWSGRVVGRAAHFPQSPRFDDQPENTGALIGQVEYYIEGPEGDAFTLTPYVRGELHEDGDTFTDVREALWLTYGDDWEFRAGVGKVFWGVTEAVHLVDIVNQTDFQEDVDGEEKLGQPMLQATFLPEWGTLSLFVLPGFRERELPEVNDRPRFALPVDNDAARFESSDEERHIDAAVRFSRNFDELDVSLSHFSGTAREPRLAPNADGSALVPFYPLIDQTGLEVQYTAEEWLWKLEAIHVSDDEDDYSAAAGGFEFTVVGLFETAHDLGIIAEYLYDERGDNADSPFQDDVLVGLRWVLNDAQSTEALFGVIQDLDGGGQAISLEASRRLGASFKVNLDARAFADTADDPQLDGFARDDFVRLELGYYF